MQNPHQTLETEEDLLTCLTVRLFHPHQNRSRQSPYALLPLGSRIRCRADDTFRLGRDPQSCSFALVDLKVSRKQLALHAYRRPHGAALLFRIQNLSQRARLSVNGAALHFLEWTDLPDKALVRFGEYEMLVTREPGEAEGSFEVEFEVLAASPSRETCARVSSVGPVEEAGPRGVDGLTTGPLETDETLLFCS